VSDSSYEVRAAALVAWAALDPAGSREAVADGLRTPSYRDAIQTAALAAAARSGDTTLVPVLAARAGDQPLVSVALAVFAARGDSAARAALARQLQDERPWVRRWTRQAMEGIARAGPSSR